MKKKIMVTGAAGFIGGRLCQVLREAGEEVLPIDCGDSLPEGVLDRRFAFFYLENMRPCEVSAVLHLGANSDTMATDRDSVMASNLLYSQRLWACCARVGVPLIYASSAATYGDGSAGWSDHTNLGELKPLNLYAESKNEFDKWALAQSDAPPWWAGLKLFNVYGPGEEKKGRMASMVLHLLRQVHDTGVARLFKSTQLGIPDGGQRRDFVYVDDVVSVFRHFARLKSARGLYNVGSGESRSFNDLAYAAWLAVGQGYPIVPGGQEGFRIEYFDMPPALVPCYQSSSMSSNSRLRESGYEGRMTSLDKGVSSYGKYLFP